MLQRLELGEADHRELIGHCAARGILFLSTPFDEGSADLLLKLKIAAFKTSSGDLTNLPFLDYLARTGRPVVLSTGMSVLAEVEDAMRALRSAGAREIIVLHCVSDYPTNPADVNLRAMETLTASFGVPVGFSDHTLGTHIAVAAVARGACMIEKHLTLDKTLPGPDHRASLEPEEFAQMIAAIRDVESALGDGLKRPRGRETLNIVVGRKSLHWRASLPAGTIVSAAHLIALRPGSGVSPAQLESLLGRRTASAVSAGSMLQESDLAA